MNRENILLNYISRILLTAAGILCIFRAPQITAWFPYVIGGLMTFTGITMFADTFPKIRKREERSDRYNSRLTRGLLLIMLGIATLFMYENAMPFIGVVWGLLGLLKGGRGITMVLGCSKFTAKTAYLLCKAIVGLALSFILLFNPVTAVGKHIIILGVQIVFYAIFKMDSKSIFASKNE